MKRSIIIPAACVILIVTVLSAWIKPVGANPYVKWTNGPSRGVGFFPIAVWLQNPRNAKQYKDAGFNTYVGLWKGPTEKQLSELKKAGMKVICHQNEVGLRHIDDPAIIGWMHGDEPDNAQSLGQGRGYGPPILPKKIVDDYLKIRAADPTRPVLLNLYPEYVKGCDIASFDIYPAAHSKPQVSGNLWYVAKGVDRLVKWTRGDKVVWNCIECTRIQNPTNKATPHQVRCEVWMSIIHGSMGLIYFVHEWKPRFNESALLNDKEMLSAVTEINQQIIHLAPVLNSPPVKNAVSVSSTNESVPVSVMTRRYEAATYLFAVGMRSGETTAIFTVPGRTGVNTVEVLGENRTILSKDGVFKDRFEPWDVHLYRITESNAD
jgi:hypothetical protein